MSKKPEKPIDIREYVPINGISQFLYHLGTGYDNPVLLYLHGGPGSVESLFAYAFQDKWEDIFTVVHWDQRGAGKTLTQNPSAYPTMELILEDLYEVVQYLKKKYHKKIVLLGHSWGSVLGSVYIRNHPEDVAYYIGTGQVINMTENEQVGYSRVKELIIQADDHKSLKKLEAIGEYPGSKVSFDKEFLKKCDRVRKLQSKYKLSSDSFLQIFNIVRKSPIFRLSDFFAFMKIFKANQGVYGFFSDFNLWAQSKEYKIPVYYILGGDDWQAPHVIAEKYFNELLAPRKKIYLIPNARHMAMVDQPDLFYQSLFDIYSKEKATEPDAKSHG
jgi:Predicted hydrolases or acyltransferases (alpha/beta hydrolase superfamily)